MRKKFFTAASIMGALAVIFGAFGSHLLKKLVPADVFAGYQTAIQYQFYHTFAVLFIGLLYQKFRVKHFVWAGHCFIIGVVFFCGSLYAATILSAGKSDTIDALNAITPFGGLFLISGWVLMLLGVLNARY
jgi:uncharacterized membrane protein YgdD (TMEM256/DUF423 family)